MSEVIVDFAKNTVKVGKEILQLTQSKSIYFGQNVG